MNQAATRQEPPSANPPVPTLSARADRSSQVTAYQSVRQTTEALCEPLAVEDFVIQSMPDASPVKWHLAHTTWFFETFLLSRFLPGYEPFHPQFGYLFNSYYNAIGPRWSRPQRGLLSRPTVAEIFNYREYVDENVRKLLLTADSQTAEEIAPIVVLGMNHEQQHQELIITDLKHAWAANPLHPIYRTAVSENGDPPPNVWLSFPEDLVLIGHDGDSFAFDNETPRHRIFVQEFQLAKRLVTNRDYLAFMNDAGYDRPELWLSDGWNARQAANWTAPLYWLPPDVTQNNSRPDCQSGPRHDGWSIVTLSGLRPLEPAEPVCHVSYYEADAFARWAGARLPTEAEWEVAAADQPLAGHFLEGNRFHPAAVPAAADRGPLYQMFGDVWQWTASSYSPYPGYQPLPGALGEYNAKFMCNQLVLRGASCATPRSHARLTYRNFFPADARWQFSGIRLAKDLA